MRVCLCVIRVAGAGIQLICSLRIYWSVSYVAGFGRWAVSWQASPLSELEHVGRIHHGIKPSNRDGIVLIVPTTVDSARADGA